MSDEERPDRDEGAPSDESGSPAANGAQPRGTACPACGEPARDAARYCEHCGVALPARCGGCGGVVHPGARFCGSCGENLRRDRVADSGLEERQGTVLGIAAPAADRLLRPAEELDGEVVELHDACALVFGARRSLEDHLERAIVVALRLRGTDPSGAVGLGVASGPLSPDSATWTTDPDGPIARAIDLAAGSEPGEILVDAALTPLIPESVVVDAVPGRDDAGRVVERRQQRRALRRRRARPPTRFVGRERQLLELDEALALAEAGSGRAIGIVAEPGMGKSRLVEEARRRVADRARWVGGRCSPYGTHRAYLPLVDLARELCGVSGLPASAVARGVAATIARIDAPAAEVPFLLNLLGGVRSAEEEARITALSPEAVRTRTFAALRHLLLAAASERPLVAEIEDIHWADDTSARFLESLAPTISGAPILLLTTYRPGTRPTWLDLSHATQMALPQLPPAASLEVVRSVLEVDDVPEGLGRVLLDRGAGNPFFLEELALAAQDAGGADDVPRTVQDVLMARIDRLPVGARSALQTAAVLGRRFPVQLLASVWAGGTPLRDELETLAREEFVVEALVDGEVGCAFRHALTQDVAYRSLGAGRRTALHESAGLSLEALYAGRTDEVDGLLAHHWSRTEDAPRAVAYLQRAADASARGYAHAEATTMLREALRHAERLPASEREQSVVELTLRRVASLYFLGRMDESQRALDGLTARVETLADPPLECAYRFWTAHTASHLGMPDLAERAARASIELAEALDDRAALGRARYIRVRQGWWTGSFEEGVREGDAAIPLLEEAGEVWWLGHCHFFVAHSLYSMGRFDAALESAARGEAIGDAVADPRLRSWAAWAHGLYEAARGDPDAGIERCQAGIELSPDEPNTAWALGARGFARREQGDLDGAIVDLRRAIGLAESTRHPGIRARFLGWLAEALRRAEDLAEASAVARRSGETAERIGCRWVMALALRTQGRIAADEGDLDQARRRLREARAALEAIGCAFDLALCHMDLARLSHRQGRDPEPPITMAREILDGLPAPIYRQRLAALARELDVGEIDAAGIARLTPREREVLALIAEGCTNREIAERLVISEGTAIRHVSNIFGKLGVGNRAAATRIAIDSGVVAAGNM